ncbi:MAG TPA: alpha/beta hydrolase [Puia sp.]|nr:alpha/beta hydrolase [Puia sp.]
MATLKTSGYAPVNGLRLYYEIHGDGDLPLVLIHGGGSTIETSFGNLLPLLSAHGKVIAVELQAHGRTSDRDAPETFEQDADDVAALLAHLKVPKANILGYSDGGCTTLQLANSHPEIVNKIVVVSSNYQREGMIPGFFEGLEKATLADMPEVFKTAYKKVAPDPNHLPVMFEKDVARRLNFKDRTDDYLQSIKAATLLMASDQDVITLEHTVKMAKLIPGAKLIILPGTHGAFIGAVEAEPVKGSRILQVTTTLVEEFLHD